MPVLTPAGQRLAELVAQAEPGLVWLARRRAAGCRTPLERQRALTELAPLVAGQGELAAEGYVKDFAKIFGVGVGLVRKALAPPAPAGPGPTSPAGTSTGGPGSDTEGDLAQAINEAVDDLNASNFAIWRGNEFFVGMETTDVDGKPLVRWATEGDFKRWYRHVRLYVPDAEGKYHFKEVTDFWLKSPRRRRYERAAFRPGRDTGDDTYNLWRGWAVAPVPGDAGPFWRHVKEIVCAGHEPTYRYVRRWLAHIFQRPLEVPGVALVLRGAQGIGKGFFTDMVLQLLDPYSFSVVSMDQVAGRFNAHMRDLLLLHCNEALWGGDRSKEGVLKALITEGRFPVEGKHRDMEKGESYRRTIISTNMDWPIPMDADDRRFVVIDVPSTRQGDRAYFTALFGHMERGGGLAALMHDLLTEDLTGFEPRDKPDTGFGADIKIASGTDVVKWWHECLVQAWNQEGTTDSAGRRHPDWWDEKPLVGDLYTYFRLWCQRLNRRYPPTREQWARELRRMVPHLATHRSRTDDRERRYYVGDLIDCRRAFEHYIKADARLWTDPDPAPMPAPPPEAEYRGEF